VKVFRDYIGNPVLKSFEPAVAEWQIVGIRADSENAIGFAGVSRLMLDGCYGECAEQRYTRPLDDRADSHCSAKM
jgi:hypothetical protein